MYARITTENMLRAIFTNSALSFIIKCVNNSPRTAFCLEMVQSRIWSEAPASSGPQVTVYQELFLTHVIACVCMVLW